MSDAMPSRSLMLPIATLMQRTDHLPVSASLITMDASSSFDYETSALSVPFAASCPEHLV